MSQLPEPGRFTERNGFFFQNVETALRGALSAERKTIQPLSSLLNREAHNNRAHLPCLNTQTPGILK